MAVCACEAPTVDVSGPGVLTVETDTTGLVSVAGVKTGASALAPARFNVSGVGPWDVDFTTGSRHVRIRAVRGPHVRLAPFLRAADIEPEATARWRFVLPEGSDVRNGAPQLSVVAGGRVYAATRRETGAAPFYEVETPYGPGTVVAVWGPPGRADAWGAGTFAEPGDDLPAPTPHSLGRTLTVAAAGGGEVWVEILPRIDGLAVPLPFGAGTISSARALVARVPDSAPVAVRVRIRRVGQHATDTERLYVVPPGTTSIAVRDEPLAPMGPAPAADLADVMPLLPSEEGGRAALTWTPPADASFWGVSAADVSACRPETDWVFQSVSDPSVPFEGALAGMALLGVTVRAYMGGPDFEALTAAAASAAPVAEWPSHVGRAGWVRASVSACPGRVPGAPEGTLAVLLADGDPCDDGGLLGTARVDACGRLLVAPEPGAAAAVAGLACGRYAGSGFQSEHGELWGTRRVQPVGADAGWMVSNPEGAWLLVPVEADVSHTPAPSDWPSRWWTVSADDHLERPGTPGETLPGTGGHLGAQSPAEGPFLEIQAEGVVVARWPGGGLRGRLGVENGLGGYTVRRLPARCGAGGDQISLTPEGDTLVLRLRAAGPDIFAAPTVRIVEARFGR